MNKTLIPLLAVLLLGCQTLNPVLLDTAAGIAGLAAKEAATRDTQHRQAYVTAEAALTVIIENKNWSATDLAVALSNLPAVDDGLAGPNGDLYLAGGVMIFNLASSQVYKVTSEPAVQKVATAVRDGLRAGLAAKTRATLKLRPTRQHSGIPVQDI